MDKTTKTRLAELEKQRDEIATYKEQHREKFGMTDGELLDALEELILDEGALTLQASNGNNVTGMRGITDGLFEKIIGDGIREFIAELLKSRE